MRAQLDASVAVCHVCGDREHLDTDPVLARGQLATFAAAHSGHGRFHVEVEVMPPRGIFQRTA
jgi:hypothetical protein